ncbi:hypothetical protein [Gramella sp. Hel_I_59]|uniref:hypothetical protein n=1 Tax=Gramella sp. Hel_I_59 TaxID=1249978 RepID=UPI00114DF2E1|nr:hypothetical protein [Gramella sp. Hel_I_59]
MKPTVVTSLQDEVKIDRQVQYLSGLTKVLFLIAISLLVFLITSSTYSDSGSIDHQKEFEGEQLSNTSALNPPAPF